MKYFLRLTLPIVFLFFTQCHDIKLSYVTDKSPTKTTIDRASLGLLNQEGNIYRLAKDDIHLLIDSTHGARIASLLFKGNQVLSLLDIERGNWGSTFWTSPQSDWGWPSPEHHDSKPYLAHILNRSILFTGAIEPTLKTYLSKEISFLERQKNTLIIKYGIHTTSSDSIWVAPWEVTRLPRTGFSFFEIENKDVRTDDDIHVQITSNKYAWLDFSGKPQQQYGKLYANGKGWIAHVKDDLLYLKVFQNVAVGKSAPNEAEIEIYSSPVKPYIELEPQGMYKTVSSSASYTWSVIWKIIEIPDDIIVKPGSEDLIALAIEEVSGLKRTNNLSHH